MRLPASGNDYRLPFTNIAVARLFCSHFSSNSPHLYERTNDPINPIDTINDESKQFESRDATHQSHTHVRHQQQQQ
jgi:hypothetical protein